MNFSVLLQPLLHLRYFIPPALLLGTLRDSGFKGHLEASVVSASARLFLDKDPYHLIRNVTVNLKQVMIETIEDGGD